MGLSVALLFFLLSCLAPPLSHVHVTHLHPSRHSCGGSKGIAATFRDGFTQGAKSGRRIYESIFLEREKERKKERERERERGRKRERKGERMRVCLCWGWRKIFLFLIFELPLSLFSPIAYPTAKEDCASQEARHQRCW